MDRNTELLARFEREYLDIKSVTEHRRKNQFILLRKFAATLDGPLDTMTASQFATFIGAQIQSGLMPATVLKHHGMVRSFITWTHQAGLIEPERIAQLRSVPKPRVARNRPNPYKASEIKAFHKLLATKYPALPTYGKGSRAMRTFMLGRARRLQRHLWRHAKRLQWEAQIALALEQGLRCIEIYRLTIPALHPDNDELVVLTAKQGPHAQVRRAIPYTTHARACVEEWLDFRRMLRPPHDSPWLALTLQGSLDRQLAPLQFDNYFRLDRVFGHPWRWHRFRHTAGTEWLRSGVPLELVSRFLGHASLEQTRAYTEILPSDISAGFDRAEADFAQRLGLVA